MSVPDSFPNIYVARLAQSLAVGGTETEVYVSSITTLDGQVIQTSDFSYLGRGILSVDVQSALSAEFISFTGVDPDGIGFTPIVRGLSFKSNDVIPANKKFHAVGAPVIIAFGTHNLIDLETIIIDNYNAIIAIIGGLGSTYLEIDGGNSPTANINWNNHKITNLAEPTSNQDAATKLYVDESLAGGAPPASAGTPGLVNIATNTQFNAGTNTETIMSLVYYNLATITQIQGYVNTQIAAIHGYSSGVLTTDVSAPTVIAHGLGKIPARIRVTTYYAGGTEFPMIQSEGTYNGTVTNTIYVQNSGGGTGFVSATDTTNIVYIYDNGAYSFGVATFDSTNITITWTNGDGGADTQILWEAYLT